MNVDGNGCKGFKSLHKGIERIVPVGSLRNDYSGQKNTIDGQVLDTLLWISPLRVYTALLPTQG